MSKSFRVSLSLVFVAGFIVSGMIVLSASPAWSQEVKRMEVGAEYSFVETNAPPGGCGCFQLNGGAGWFAFNFSPRLAIAAEVGSTHASNVDGTTGDLTLTSFLGGPKYSWRKHRLVPYGQVLLGGAHASGALTPSAAGFASSSNAFAMAAGGGVDLDVSRRWAVRIFQLDYYLTRFDNGVNDHQNNLRLGFGVAYRFGREM